METNKEGFLEFKAKIRKGSIGDMQAEWMTEDDWKKHAEYVEELKAKGEYLKEEEITILTKPHPVFNDRPMTGKPLQSFRFIMLDMGSDENFNIQKVVRVPEPFVKEESLEEKHPETYKIVKSLIEKAIEDVKDKRSDQTDLPHDRK